LPMDWGPFFLMPQVNDREGLYVVAKPNYKPS